MAYDTFLASLILHGAAADKPSSVLIPPGTVYATDDTDEGFLWDGSAWQTLWLAGGSGTGDVVGPASATANDVAGFDGTTGKLIKDLGPYDPSHPGCIVHNSADITCTNSAVTVLTFDTEDYDPTGMHSTVTNSSRITFNEAGLYIITAQLTGEVVTGTAWIPSIQINGSTLICEAEVNTTSTTFARIPPLCALYNAAANDYAEVAVYSQASGNKKILHAAAYSPYFSAQKIR